MGIVARLRVLLTGDDKEFQKSMAGVSKKMHKQAREFDAIGRQLTKTVTLPLVAIAAGALKAGTDMQSAMSTIARATGATGDALTGLGDSFRRVLRTVPENAQVVSAAMGDLNTRLGLTGSALEETTRHLLTFARINNQDVATSTRLAGQLMNALGIEASELPTVLDKLTFASQRSGINVGALAQNVIEAGPAFGEMGFELDRSIALFSEFEKVGARPTELLGSLNMAMTRMAKSGAKDAKEAFSTLLDSIKNAPTLMDAVRISSEAFGSRVGAKLAEDIRQGRFAVDDFVEALQQAPGTMTRTAEESRTLGEIMGQLRNRIVTAGSALGDDLIRLIERYGIPAVERLAVFVERAAQMFSNLPEPIKMGAFAVAGLAAAAGPLLIAFATLQKTAALLIGMKALGGVAAAMGLIVSPVGLVVAGLLGGAGLIALFVHLARESETLSRILGDVWGGLKDIATIIRSKAVVELEGLRTAIGHATDALSSLWDWLRHKIPAGLLATQQEIRSANASIFKMNDHLEDMQKAAASGGRSLKDMANDSNTAAMIATKGINTIADEMTDSAIRIESRALAPLTDAAAMLAIQTGKANESMGVIAGVGIPKLEASTTSAMGSTAGLSQQMDGVTRGSKRLASELTPLQSSIEGVTDASLRLAKAQATVAQGMSALNEEFATQAAFARQMSAEVSGAITVMQTFGGDVLPRLEHSMEAVRQIGMDGMWAVYADQAREANTATESLGQTLREVLGGIPDLITKALTGGGGMIGAFKALGSQLLSGLGKSLLSVGSTANTLLSRGIGSVFGKSAAVGLSAALPGIGAALGAVAGPALGKLFGGLFGSKAKQEMREANQAIAQMTAQLTETHGGLDQIGKIGRALGVDLAGAFSGRGKQGLDALQQAAEHFEQRLGAVRDEMSRISKEGGLASAELIRFRDAMADTAEVGEFIKGQVQTAIGGLKTFLDNATLTSQAAATAMGSAVAGAFAELRAQGMSAIDALKILEPVILSLREQFKETGFTGGAAFNAIAKLARIAKDEIAGPALAAVDGMNVALQGLHNSGLLNQEIFAGLARQVADTFNDLIEKGFKSDQILQLMQPTLQTLWRLQQDFGFEVDATTQKLIDQAKEAGLVGDKHRTAMERAAMAMERVADALESIIGKTNQFGRSLENLPRHIPINVNYTTTGQAPAGGSVPKLQHGGIVRKPTLALLGEAGPEAVIPLTGGGGLEQTIIVQLDGRQISRVVVREMPSILAVQGVAV